MLNVSLDNRKYVSRINCNKREGYRKIYLVSIGNSNVTKINLYTECIGVLITKMTNAFNIEFSNNDETDYDTEMRIESKLGILLNKKISVT